MSPERDMEPERRAALVPWRVTCAVLALAGTFFAAHQFMHHDVAYYVNAVGRMLDGARLYRDLIDVNVPTIYGVMTPAIVAARWLGVDPILSFQIYVVALAYLGAGLLWAAARLVYGRSTAVCEIVAGAGLVAYLLVPGPDFGEREHIAAMFLVPYAVLRAAAPGGAVRLRLAVGTTAGIAVALKPYFLLPVAGIELARLILHRDRLRSLASVESVALGAVVAAAAALTLLLFPDYRDRILPLARATYHGFEVAPQWLLAMMLADGRDYVVALVIAAVLACAGEPASVRLVGSLCGGALGAFLAYWLQAKSWSYQLLPALVFSLIAFWAALADTALRGPFRRGGGLAVLCGLAVLELVIGLAQFASELDYDRQLRSRYAPVLATLRSDAGHDPVLFISVTVDQTFPSVNYAGRPYPYRYHHLLPLPGLYSNFAFRPGLANFRSPSQMGPIERRFFEEFVSDALDHPPSMIFVDRRPIWLSDAAWRRSAVKMDLLAYFCQSLRFAKFMSAYVYGGRVSDYDLYLVGGAPDTSQPPAGCVEKSREPAVTTALGTARP
jgi:hypothetical protein